MSNINNEILEGNKLIAEFMNHPFIKKWKRYNYKGEFPYKDLKYHSSFNWLMPVWYKFRDLKFNEETLSKLHLNYIARLAQDLAYGTIEEFFSKLLVAIKWYNQNKQS